MDRRAWQAIAVRKLVLTAVALIVVLAGCTGESGPTPSDLSPEERLAEAERNLDAADFISFTLKATSLPDGLEGLLSAKGTGTHAPAFTGEVQVQSSVDLTAPLIAVGGTVYAKLPFVGWSVLDPADYGAPDPADLLAREGGISSLLAATTDLREGDSERTGEQVLTAIDGTLPGTAMQSVFPSAGSEDFTVNYTLTDGNDLSGVQVTGPFYPDAADVTYRIDLDVDADSVDIQAPI